MRVLAAACAVAWLALAGLQAPPPPEKQDAGLATRYPGDRGIEGDPAVLFRANFERGDTRDWDESKGPVTITGERPSAGARCLAIPMHRGRDTGGHLIKWFRPGADTVYARFYVRFSKDYRYSHHFVCLLANPPNNRWGAFGKAGLKPDGTYFSSGMEPWFAWGKNPPPGEVNLYTYYPDMDIDPKMGRYWGNAFFPPGPGKGRAAGPDRVIPPLDRWQCWEFMIRANSAADRADGRQAMWVNGRLVGSFTGIRWRTHPDVKIDCLWLEHYGYDDGDPTREYWTDSQTVWFDDVVVATRYIGPMARAGAVNAPGAARGPR